MNNKFLFAVLALFAVAIAVLGFVVLNQPAQTGGSSAPNYAVAGDPNYAIAVYSTTTTGFTLGNLTQTSSSKIIAITLPRGLSYGLKLGDTCGVQLSSASSTGGWSADAQITAISNQSSSASVTFFSGAPSSNTTVSTGTVTLACQNF